MYGNVSLTQRTWVWASSRSWWWTGKPGIAAVHGVAKSQAQLSDWTEEVLMPFFFVWCSLYMSYTLQTSFKTCHPYQVMFDNDFMTLSCFAKWDIGKDWGSELILVEKPDKLPLQRKMTFHVAYELKVEETFGLQITVKYWHQTVRVV